METPNENCPHCNLEEFKKQLWKDVKRQISLQINKKWDDYFEAVREEKRKTKAMKERKEKEEEKEKDNENAVTDATRIKCSFVNF